MYIYIYIYIYVYIYMYICICSFFSETYIYKYIYIYIYIYNLYNIYTPRLPHGRWHTHVGARWRYAVLCYCSTSRPRCTWPQKTVMAAWWTSSCRGGPTSTWRTGCVQGVGCLFFCGEMLVSFLVEVILFMCVHMCIHMYIHIYILYDIIRYHIIYAYIYKSCILHKHTQI